MLTRAALALVLVPAAVMAADTDAFLTAFHAQAKAGLVLKNTQGECKVSLKSPTASPAAMELQTNMKSAWIGGIYLGETSGPGGKLEKMNAWNWGTTDNIGRDTYRYTAIVKPALGGDYVNEVTVSVKQKTNEVVAFTYRQYHFRASKLSGLDQSFTDIVNVRQQVDCFR